MLLLQYELTMAASRKTSRACIVANVVLRPQWGRTRSSKVWTDVTAMRPQVRVPVLSKTTADTWLARSNTSPPFTSTPSCAATPVPT